MCTTAMEVKAAICREANLHDAACYQQHSMKLKTFQQIFIGKLKSEQTLGTIASLNQILYWWRRWWWQWQLHWQWWWWWWSSLSSSSSSLKILTTASMIPFTYFQFDTLSPFQCILNSAFQFATLPTLYIPLYIVIVVKLIITRWSLCRWFAVTIVMMGWDSTKHYWIMFL